MRLAFSGLAISLVILGVAEIANGHTVAGAASLGAGLISGLVWGAKGGIPPHDVRADEETERAKTSAISRWRNRS